jgi:hypothetical protein
MNCYKSLIKKTDTDAILKNLIFNNKRSFLYLSLFIYKAKV